MFFRAQPELQPSSSPFLFSVCGSNGIARQNSERSSLDLTLFGLILVKRRVLHLSNKGERIPRQMARPCRCTAGIGFVKQGERIPHQMARPCRCAASLRLAVERHWNLKRSLTAAVRDRLN